MYAYLRFYKRCSLLFTVLQQSLHVVCTFSFCLWTFPVCWQVKTFHLSNPAFEEIASDLNIKLRHLMKYKGWKRDVFSVFGFSILPITMLGSLCFFNLTTNLSDVNNLLRRSLNFWVTSLNISIPCSASMITWYFDRLYFVNGELSLDRCHYLQCAIN